MPFIADRQASFQRRQQPPATLARTFMAPTARLERLARALRSSPQALLASLILGFAPAQTTPEQPLPAFVEETAEAGIEHVYQGGWEFVVGGGVAAFDCSGDHLPELFLAGGNGPARLFLNRSEVGGPLRFEAVDAPAALAGPAGMLEGVLGGYPLDIDSDGQLDLALLRLGENLLLRGLGECRFERANERWGFSGGSAWSTAFAATWEPGRAWPTLAVGNYVDRSAPGSPFGTCDANQLHRPEAGERRFAAPLQLTPSYCALSMLFSDWNRSGRPDLRISNDRQYYLTNRDRSGGEQLWRLADEGPVLYGPEDGWQQLQLWGMGIASADLTGDGYPDYFLTSMTDNKLRTLAAGPARPEFRDLAFDLGVTAHRAEIGPDAGKPSTGWHAQFGDVNNDGLSDLFIAKGNVEAMQDFALFDPNSLLLGRADGRFVEAAAAAELISYRRARGAALIDLNLDGLLDLAVVNRGEASQLWRNLGADHGAQPSAPGNWLQLRLRQPGGNRDAVGAWLELRSDDLPNGSQRWRELTVGGGHAGGSQGWIHFGLGPAGHASLRVHWPDGETGPWLHLEANRFYLLERGRRDRNPLVAGGRPTR